MTSAKLAADIIAHTHIADNAVQQEHLSGGSVTETPLGTDSVTQSAIKDGPYMTTWATGTIYRDTTNETLKVYNPPPPGGGGMPP
eukprot:SAG22_NODE_571_length_9011_cov_292.011670_9_plen_85_part_00